MNTNTIEITAESAVKSIIADIVAKSPNLCVTISAVETTKFDEYDSYSQDVIYAVNRGKFYRFGIPTALCASAAKSLDDLQRTIFSPQEIDPATLPLEILKEFQARSDW